MASAMNQFGEHLRNLRRQREMSQDRLGEVADLNPKYIGELERGVGNPSLQVLMKLAKALGVDLATLVGDDIARMPVEQVRAEAHRQVDAMTDDEARDLVRLLRLRAR